MKHSVSGRWLALLTAVLMLALVPAASFAEVTVVSEQKLENSLYLNDGTNTYYSRVDGGYALFDATGNQLSDVYRDITAREGGVYLRVYNDNSINNYGVLNSTGTLVMPMAYGDIDFINEKWVLGYVLELTDDANGDYYDRDNNQYNIARVDVYFQGAKIGELTREDLPKTKSIGAHGNYLYIKQVDGKGFFLNGSFERTDYETDYFYTSSEYEEVYRDGIYHRPTNQKVFVETCTLTPDEVDQAVWYDDKGNFVDLQGNIISQGKTSGKEYNYVSYRGNFFYTTSNDGHGLTALDGTEIVEPVYSDIGGGTDSYFVSGYQSVMRDGKLLYLDLAGNVTATAEYPLSSSDYRGFYNNAPFVTVDNMGQKIVITATAGELAQKYQDAGYPQAGQRVLAVQLDDAWGVIDMQGNTVIPFIFRSSPDITDDGTLICGRTKDGYVLYTLAYTVEPAPTTEQVVDAQDGSWVCPACNETVTSNFCPNDGTARPEEETVPTCSNCGYQPADGVAPKFCPECGTAFN